MDRLQQLQQLLQESPGDSFILFALAKECEKRLDDEGALRYFLQLKASDPQYVGLYYHLGKLYERLDRPGEASEAYRAGMEVAKAAGDRHAYAELAGAKLALGDEEDFL